MEKSVAYYLSIGMDQKMAEYFATGRRSITDVVPNADFTLTLTFDNGEKRVLDIAPMIKPGTVFAFLSDIRNFNRVYLDREHCVCWDVDPDVDSDVVWSNKVDLCPDGCYVDSVPLDEVDLQMIAEAKADPDCKVFISKEEAYKELGL